MCSKKLELEFRSNFIVNNLISSIKSLNESDQTLTFFRTENSINAPFFDQTLLSGDNLCRATIKYHTKQ